MNKYEDKCKRMYKHLENHPHDYQTVISLFKAESDAIMWDRKQKRIKMIREVAKYRREQNAKQAQQ